MIYHFGLTGFPLAHSLSPKIHAAALKACGFLGDYALFPVAPEDEHGRRELLNRVRLGELHGLNVTIPRKQTVIPLLDELAPTARAIGAVNTIFMQSNKLTGDNTDAPGFLADLHNFLTTEAQERGDTKSALVFGAGGSARAVVYALLNDGWNVALAARRLEQAHRLARYYAARSTYHDSQISSVEYQTATLYSLLPTLSLIINTTPLGMTPNTDASPWPADLPFPSQAAVYDLVYNPRETKLVREARAAGLPATTGLGMLVEQAALAFETWTGRLPPRAVLFDAIA